MKNIHILPTDNKLSRLYFNVNDKEFQICEIEKPSTILKPNRHIYITSNEEIKEGDWYCHNQINYLRVSNSNAIPMDAKKIILTTDQDLIDDGVQGIDDKFLEWFIKNPSCEEVEVEGHIYKGQDETEYKIIIPKEEPKQETLAYKLVAKYYGDKTTKRNGVKLINHIDEGIEILKNIGADEDTIDAYCLHPILQSDEEFNKNLTMDFSGIRTSVLLLAVEYRRVANSYLSTDKIESFVGFTNKKIKQMLYADKIQNEKDFALYHENKHERSKELREYFNNWLNILLK